MERPVRATGGDVVELLRNSGALDEADRVWDAIDAGEDLGEALSAEEVARRLSAMCASKR